MRHDIEQEQAARRAAERARARLARLDAGKPAQPPRGKPPTPNVAGLVKTRAQAVLGIPDDRKRRTQPEQRERITRFPTGSTK